MELTGKARGREGDILVALRFEFFIRHTSVAGGIAALAAERVDNDAPAGLTGSTIEGDLALLNVKCSMDSMQNVAQSKVDVASGGVNQEVLLSTQYRR